MFVGALIHTYLDPNIRISQTAQKKAGSITIDRKMSHKGKHYMNRSG